MTTVSNKGFLRATTGLVLLGLMAVPAASYAQAKTAPAAAASDDTTVVITGTRRSVQSAIDRKKRSGTVSDSIVAEDINQFPDKNVGEALARVTGVQLTRDFGEGTQVAIRGVEPNLNRIEINGMTALNDNNTAGRGAELREFPSELVSSIDVFKGFTADMTEGGVGGTVSIHTRRPLDFKKPTAVLTISGENLSTRSNDGWKPRGSLFLTKRFLDGRLGVMANITYDNVLTRNDYDRNTSWNYLRDWDFTTAKTITSNDPVVAAIPTGIATNLGSNCTTANGLTAAQVTACQKQWFDYAPNTARYGIWTRDHERTNGEFTVQYKFSDNFTGWASLQTNTQHQILNDRNYGTDLGAVTRLANAGIAPSYVSTTGLIAAVTTSTPAATCVPVPTTSTPAGVVVSADHRVTSYTVGSCINLAGQGGQGAFSTSARHFRLDVKSTYLSGGFNYHGDRWDAEGLVAKTDAHYSNDTNAISLTLNAPGLVVTENAQGPLFTFPTASSPENSANYVQAQLQYRPTESDVTENQVKLDLKYHTGNKLFPTLWFGVQSRDATSIQYNGGGYLASTGASPFTTADDINVMTANINQTIIWDPLFCPTGTCSAQRVNDTQSFINSNFKTSYTNHANMTALVDAIRERSPGTFFNGYSGVSGLPTDWMAPNEALAEQFFDTSHFNHANVRSALGSDGKVYPQIPAYNSAEKIKAAYFRTDIEGSLFGWEIDGNAGLRYVSTEESSAGLQALKQRRCTASTATVTVASCASTAVTDDTIIQTLVAVDNKYSDVLPSFNLSAWIIPNQLTVRLGYSKVMSRPSIDKLAPNATCVLGSGLVAFGGDGSADDCTAGNPDLKPYRSTDTDLSIEYYPNRDSQFSVAFFKKNIDSYILNSQIVKNVDFFHNGTLLDVTQTINAQGAITQGMEVTARTAFSFLPGVFSGLGADVNYTSMSFSYPSSAIKPLNALDGSILPYPGLSPTSYNVTLWYDKDFLNARLSYNYRDRFYTGSNDVIGNPNFQEAGGWLDGRISYRMNKNITFFFEGKNLTDTAQITDAGDLSRTNELAYSGRRFFFGVTLKN